ncbi:hypothetical protein [uncultured Thiodictyon sp.]|uniref:hypothetical protein n=1 Tax=uncultured Thiodictyon sp. TaxID=1846217 RepID=UPI0025F962E9|nr:hypothetical protein [uncultured Thiodictyon sp.]
MDLTREALAAALGPDFQQLACGDPVADATDIKRFVEHQAGRDRACGQPTQR